MPIWDFSREFHKQQIAQMVASNMDKKTITFYKGTVA
jgi:hypothetical protein